MESGARTIIVLILYSALFSCNAAGGGSRLSHGGEMIFNVLSFGAKPGQIQESTQVNFAILLEFYIFFSAQIL